MKDSAGRWKPYSDRDKYPCKKDGIDCPLRHLGCQDTCGEMLAAKLVNGYRKDMERKKRIAECSAGEVKYKGYLAVMRKKMPER